MHLEIHDPKVIAGLQREAEALRRPVKEVVEMALKQHVEAHTSEDALLPASEYFRRIQERLLAERGGKLFSDSADIIRESREHDH